ncbi:MAG: 2OG-Fe(II) oxygenase [Halioglobus sp.]|nr:2OG-Fe(II) oxygenase [Halioglobus sp.]
MSQINLEVLRVAPLQADPFDFFIAPGFISRETLAHINNDYPAIDTAANHTLEDLAYGPTFGSLMDELQGPEVATVIGEKFSLDLATLPTTITVRKFCERTDGNIHTDHRSKIITVLIYFNEEWNHADGQLRLLYAKDNIDNFAAEIPPLGGTLLAFRRTDHSWHGHTQFVGERRMVQMNYLDQSRLAVAAQRLSRFGTHFMKNVLGVR